ncbi:hypothetical protein AKJ09_01862 [Labilithrix luteola]|uniref:Uncharacterized protein n=1 Tax=Labilithrix luteola TaxID=1391654 RepID=A0A0K1PNU4_9BACT|nr:hypothetical protein [Labilithrix luteola]AKU95198.1 hypothetical protein AKJ09_01862 [Labilithrix luteola]
MPQARSLSSFAIATLVAGILLTGLSLEACSGPAENVPTPQTDAGGGGPAVDANGDDGDATPVDDPLVPTCRVETANWEPTNGTTSSNFSPVFEVPAGTELRSLYRTRVLGFDQPTKQFVVYSTRMWGAEMFEVHEDVRLNPGYERAVLAEGVLACRDTACDFVVWREDTGSPVAAHPVVVPEEVAPTTTTQNCVGGRGIVCLDDAGAWTTALDPDFLPAPIAAFVRLHEDHFLVADTNGVVFLVRSGVVVPFNSGTSEPVVELSGVAYPYSDVWAARTANGRLVRGTLAGGEACDLQVDSVEAGSAPDLVLRRGDRMVFTGFGRGRGAIGYAIPPESIAVGYNLCGIALNPFTIDAHHIYAPPLACYID